MRICAFLILGLLVFASFSVRSRLPPRPRKFELAVFFEPFRDLRFNVLALAAFLFFLGIFIPINFIEVEAMQAGMSTHLATYLIPILNAASIFGRIVPGILAGVLTREHLQMTYVANSAPLH